jgi:hypothetical protein
VSDTYTVLHDPHGLIDAELPLDRAPYEALVTAVLAWQDPNLTSAWTAWTPHQSRSCDLFRNWRHYRPAQVNIFVRRAVATVTGLGVAREPFGGGQWCLARGRQERPL